MRHDSTAAPCVCTSVRKASRSISRLYDDALAEAGMTAAQLAILRGVQRAGVDGLPLSHLAKSLVMDRTSLYRSLSPLVDNGWIDVETASGRTKIARLAPEGQRALRAADKPWAATQSKIVRAFGADRWRELQRQLAELVELGARFGEHSKPSPSRA